MEKGKNSCYVIGSGVSYSIENLVETVFEYYGLDWKKYVDVDENCYGRRSKRSLLRSKNS